MAVFDIRRSVLFTPGNHEHRMQKALTLGADTVCFDLEDAVRPEEKESAREMVQKVLTDTPPPAGGPERCVRVNALTSDLWRADARAAVHGGADAIMVPKAQDALEVAKLGETLSELENEVGIRPGQTRILLIFETARGVLDAGHVSEAAGARLGAILFGAEDLAADAGLVRTKGSAEVLYARSRVALVASALGVSSIDQVFTDINDVDALAAEALFARTLGYGGKMAIHPNQLAPIHRAFTPSVPEVQHAQRLLTAAQQHAGVFKFEGRMIDQPLLTQAERVLRIAQRAGMLFHG